MKAIAGVVVSCFVLDQFTKYLAQKYLNLHETVEIIGIYVRLVLVRNRGGAFGLFGNLPFREHFFIIISIVALGILVYLFIKCPRDNRLMQFAIALIGGGALGNLYDRLIHKEVVDFIDIGVSSHYAHRWPTFNVADIVITVGVILVLWETMRSFKREGAEELSSS